MKLTTKKLKEMIKEELSYMMEEDGKTAGIIYLMRFRFYPQTERESGRMEYMFNLSEGEQYIHANLEGEVVGDQEGALLVRRLIDGEVNPKDFANYWNFKLKRDHSRWNVPQEVIMKALQEKRFDFANE